MSMIIIHMIHPNVTREHLGLIPYMLNPDNPASARDQFDTEYQHGGGWRPMSGWTLMDDDKMQYQEGEEELEKDPPLSPLAEITWGRNERILIYDYSWVAIIKPDRSFEMSRMD